MSSHSSEHKSAPSGQSHPLHELALELGLARPGPRDFKRPDARIREDVCERLAWEGGVDVSEVTVEVTEGTVILAGTVPQRPMKHRIEDLSAACSGVKDVDNRIRVAPMEARLRAPESSEAGITQAYRSRV